MTRCQSEQLVCRLKRGTLVCRTFPEIILLEFRLRKRDLILKCLYKFKTWRKYPSSNIAPERFTKPVSKIWWQSLCDISIVIQNGLLRWTVVNGRISDWFKISIRQARVWERLPTLCLIVSTRWVSVELISISAFVSSFNWKIFFKGSSKQWL